LALGGCAELIATVNYARGVSIKDAQQAIAAKDYDKLKDLCTGRTPIRSSIANHQNDACDAAFRLAEEKLDAAFLGPLCGKRKQPSGRRYEGACHAMLHVAVRTNSDGAIAGLCASDGFKEACTVGSARRLFGDLDHPDCTTLRSKVAEAEKTFLKPGEASVDLFGQVAAALARCDEGRALFEQIAHVEEILLSAERRAPAALSASFARYLQGQQGAKLFAGLRRSAVAAAGWLTRMERHALCQPLAAAATDADEVVVAALMTFFVAAACRDAAPLATRLLAHDSPAVRLIGCHALARLGDASAIGKVQVLAATDRAYRVLERPRSSGVFVKEYFVAEACQQAAGQIQLRAR